MNSLIYDLMSGEIKKSVRATVASDAQAVSSGEGHIEVGDNDAALTAMRHYRVDDGEVAQKAEVTLARNAATFSADGTSEGQITLTGLTQDAQVHVDQSIVTVTVADPVLVITSDVPRIFAVQVVDAYHWSEIVMIEAV